MGAIWSDKRVRWASYVVLFLLFQVWLTILGNHSEADLWLVMFTGFGAVGLWGAGLLALEKIKGQEFWGPAAGNGSPSAHEGRSTADLARLAALIIVPILVWVWLLLFGLRSAVMPSLTFVAQAFVMAALGLVLMKLVIERQIYEARLS